MEINMNNFLFRQSATFPPFFFFFFAAVKIRLYIKDELMKPTFPEHPEGFFFFLAQVTSQSQYIHSNTLTVYTSWRHSGSFTDWLITQIKSPWKTNRPLLNGRSSVTPEGRYRRGRRGGGWQLIM